MWRADVSYKLREFHYAATETMSDEDRQAFGASPQLYERGDPRWGGLLEQGSQRGDGGSAVDGHR